MALIDQVSHFILILGQNRTQPCWVKTTQDLAAFRPVRIKLFSTVKELWSKWPKDKRRVRFYADSSYVENKQTAFGWKTLTECSKNNSWKTDQGVPAGWVISSFQLLKEKAAERETSRPCPSEGKQDCLLQNTLGMNSHNKTSPSHQCPAPSYLTEHNPPDHCLRRASTST